MAIIIIIKGNVAILFLMSLMSSKIAVFETIESLFIVSDKQLFEITNMPHELPCVLYHCLRKLANIYFITIYIHSFYNFVNVIFLTLLIN